MRKNVLFKISAYILSAVVFAGGGAWVGASFAGTGSTGVLPESAGGTGMTNLTSVLNAKALKSTTISTTAPLTGGGDLSENRTFAVSTATESAVGVVERATAGEVLAGTDTTRFVSPYLLPTRTILFNHTGQSLASNTRYKVLLGTWTPSFDGQVLLVRGGIRMISSGVGDRWKMFESSLMGSDSLGTNYISVSGGANGTAGGPYVIGGLGATRAAGGTTGIYTIYAVAYSTAAATTFQGTVIVEGEGFVKATSTTLSSGNPGAYGQV